MLTKQSKIGNNPNCIYCQGKTWKKKQYPKTTFYWCQDCKKTFHGEKLTRAKDNPKCQHCKIGETYCSSAYWYKNQYFRTYICKNCGSKTTPSPFGGANKNTLKRKISSREMLELRMEGQSYRKIAHAAGISKSAVREALFRETNDIKK